MRGRYIQQGDFEHELAEFLSERSDLLRLSARSWTEGECLNLAIALSAELGRPARPWVIVCRHLDPGHYQREHACHVYVKLADGTCLDGDGVHSEDQLKEVARQWHERLGNATEQRVEPLQNWHTEIMCVDKDVVRNIRQALQERFG